MFSFSSVIPYAGGFVGHPLRRGLRQSSVMGVLLAIGLLAASCQQENPWQSHVNAALDMRERGLNEKNMALYLSVVSQNYGGDATGHTRIKERAEKLFGSIDQIRYTSSERSLYQEDDGRIRAVQRFAMDLMRNQKSKSLSGQEQLFLAQDADGKFRIVDGL